MKWIICFVVTMLTLPLPNIVLADTLRTGNELLSKCTALVNSIDRGSQRDPSGAGYCSGIMLGMMDMNTFNQAKVGKPSDYYFCTPDGVMNVQAARIVIKYLKEHPKTLGFPDTALVSLALAEAYPCK